MLGLEKNQNIRILVFGGTGFLGGTMASAARAGGPDLNHYGLISSVPAYSDMSDPNTD